MAATKNINYLKYLLFLPLLAPFLVSLNSTPFPFVVFKAVYLSIIVGIIFLLGINWLFKQPKFFWPKNYLIPAVGCFFLIILLSIFFGVNFHNSFWGNFERMEGFVFLLPFLFYFLLLVLFFKEEKDWRIFLKASLFVGWAVALLGVIQYFSPVANPFLTLGGGERVYSTLGNFIYLGHFSLYIFWLSLILFFQEKRGKWVWLVSALVGVLGVFLAQSRGPFLALILSLFVFGLGYIFIASKKRGRLIALGGLGLIVVFLVAAIVWQPAFFKKSLVISGLTEIKTLGGSADTRLMAWDIAWQAFKERPALGWGHFNYQFAFNKFYNPGFLSHGWGETWFDHSHNQFLDTLANEGVSGFASFLSLFGLSVYYLIKKIKQDKETRFVSLAALSLLGALAVNYLFVFDSLSTWLYFFIFLAWLVFWTSSVKKELIVNRWVKILSILGIMGALITIYAGFSAWSAAKKDRAALVSFQKDPVTAVETMKTSIEETGPYAVELRHDFAQAINGVNRPTGSNAEESDLFAKMTKEGIAMLKDNMAILPRDVRHQLVLEQMYKDLIMLGDNKIADAEDLLNNLLILSPKRQQIYYYLAEVKLLKGDYDGAVAEIQKTLDGTKGVYQGYWFLAKLEGSRSNWIKAKEYLDLAREQGFSPSASEKTLVQMIEEKMKVK